MPVQNADFKDIKIDILFDAGQMQMTAGDLADLAPGMIIPLNRTAADAIAIVANGKRIGTGELVKVGEGLAVRVTQLDADA